MLVANERTFPAVAVARPLLRLAVANISSDLSITGGFFMFKSISYRIAICATFTAIAVVANIFTIDTGLRYFVISLVAIPCFFAGVLLGPIDGFLVGIISDLLGCLIHPIGPFMPLITLSTGLFGLIPGVIFHCFKRGNVYVKAVISFLLCLLICTAGLNTLACWMMYAKGKKTFFVYLGVRFPFQSIVSAINAAVSIVMLISVQRIPSLKKYFKVLQKKEAPQEKGNA